MTASWMAPQFVQRQLWVHISPKPPSMSNKCSFSMSPRQREQCITPPLGFLAVTRNMIPPGWKSARHKGGTLDLHFGGACWHFRLLAKAPAIGAWQGGTVQRFDPKNLCQNAYTSSFVGLRVSAHAVGNLGALSAKKRMSHSWSSAST
jgi:hypothetical protein